MGQRNGPLAELMASCNAARLLSLSRCSSLSPSVLPVRTKDFVFKAPSSENYLEWDCVGKYNNPGPNYREELREKTAQRDGSCKALVG